MNIVTPPIRGELLKSGDERDLILSFQSGNRTAGDGLYRAFKPLLINRCYVFQQSYPWLEWDDLFAAVEEAFLKAALKFDHKRNNGFDAHLEPYIEFALMGVLESGLRHDNHGEGRVGKWLSGDWENRRHLPIEEIALKAQVKSVENAREALEAETAIRETQPVFYDTVGEGGYDFATEPRSDIGIEDIATADDDPDDEDRNELEEPPIADAGGLGADNSFDADSDAADAGDADALDDELTDDHGTDTIEDGGVEKPINEGAKEYDKYRPLNESEWATYCHQRVTAEAQNNHGPYAKSFSAPLKPVSRGQYEADQEMAFRHVRSQAFRDAMEGLVKPRLPAVSAEALRDYEWTRAIAKAGRELDAAAWERDRHKAIWNIPLDDLRVVRPKVGDPIDLQWVAPPPGLDDAPPPRSQVQRRGVSLVRAAAGRFKKVDRQALALEMVERERKRIAGRADEAQYLYRFKRPDDGSASVFGICRRKIVGCGNR